MARLTPEQLAAMQAAVGEAFVALAVELFGVDAVAAILGHAAVAKFAADPHATGILGDAYLFGQALGKAADPAKPVPPPPGPAAFAAARGGIAAALTEWERAAAAAARQRGAALVVGLGNRVNTEMVTTAINSDNEQARAYQAKIAEEAAQTVEHREGWQTLRSRLGDALDGDWARDLGRIAATEIQASVNAGAADAITTLGAKLGQQPHVAVIPQPSACDRCRQLYLHNGLPRLFLLGQLPPSTVNFKKPQAQWVACIPPLHPWCHCQLIYVPAGWTFDASWTLRPPTAPLKKAGPRSADTAFVAINVPDPLGLWAGLGVNDPHVTLAFAEVPTGVTHEQLVDALRGAVGGVVPLQVTYGGLEHFEHDDQVVAYAPVEADPLRQARGLVRAGLDAAGAVCDGTWDFTPHVTIAYLPPRCRWAGVELAGEFTAFELHLTTQIGGRRQTSAIAIGAEAG